MFAGVRDLRLAIASVSYYSAIKAALHRQPVMARTSEQILECESGTASSPEQATLKCEPTTPQSPEYTVWWDEPENLDPSNPMNWSPTLKWANIITLSVISFLV
jgi:hypothetical protein